MGRERAHAPVSTSPADGGYGRDVRERLENFGSPASPAWKMRSDPRRASTAGSSRRCVSEITPRITRSLVIGIDIQVRILPDRREPALSLSKEQPSLRDFFIHHKSDVNAPQTLHLALRLYCPKNV